MNPILIKWIPTSHPTTVSLIWLGSHSIDAPKPNPNPRPPVKTNLEIKREAYEDLCKELIGTDYFMIIYKLSKYLQTDTAIVLPGEINTLLSYYNIISEDPSFFNRLIDNRIEFKNITDILNILERNILIILLHEMNLDQTKIDYYFKHHPQSNILNSIVNKSSSYDTNLPESDLRVFLSKIRMECRNRRDRVPTNCFCGIL